jgi:hypothetical protein
MPSMVTPGGFRMILRRISGDQAPRCVCGAPFMPATIAVKVRARHALTWDPAGTQLGPRVAMAENTSEKPTVEMSLQLLSDAVGKAADDLCAARVALDRARIDIASRNTSVSRRVVGAAERVVDHLRETDEALREVVKELEERD